MTISIVFVGAGVDAGAHFVDHDPQQELEQQAAVSGVAFPAYCSGASSNFVSQPREQKWYVSPLYNDEPTAFAGSIFIPQTGSTKRVGVAVT
jgi:hypothetical protein